MAITRREFLLSGLGAVSTASLVASPLFSWAAQAGISTSGMPLILVATGASPAENVRKVIAALGGIDKFVKPGDRVFIKPNSITPQSPEFAVNTNPDVVSEVVRLCSKAGASQITAAMHDDRRATEENGIGKAFEANGGTWKVVNEVSMYRRVNLPLGLLLRETMVVNELLDCDVFINIPVAKHHGGSRLTLGMKNYMGLNWDRQIMHTTDLHQTIADLVTVRKPDLTIIDATRMLLNNGPAGPGSVREARTIIASADLVAADAYAATMFKHKPADIPHIRYAAEMGLGEMNLNKMDIQRLKA